MFKCKNCNLKGKYGFNYDNITCRKCADLNEGLGIPKNRIIKSCDTCLKRECYECKNLNKYRLDLRFCYDYNLTSI